MQSIRKPNRKEISAKKSHVQKNFKKELFAMFNQKFHQEEIETVYNSNWLTAERKTTKVCCKSQEGGSTLKWFAEGTQ